MIEKLINQAFKNLWWISPTAVGGILLWIIFIAWRKKGTMIHVGLPLKIIIIIQVSTILLAGLFLGYKIEHMKDTTAKAYLPPYSTYIFDHVAHNVVSLLAGWSAAALLMGTLWFIFLKRGRGKMFDVPDLVLVVVGAVAVGWPAVFIFLATTFIFSVAGMLVLVLLRKRSVNDRLVITPFILPSAIVTLFSGQYLLALTHLDKIRF